VVYILFFYLAASLDLRIHPTLLRKPPPLIKPVQPVVAFPCISPPTTSSRHPSVPHPARHKILCCAPFSPTSQCSTTPKSGSNTTAKSCPLTLKPPNFPTSWFDANHTTTHRHFFRQGQEPKPAPPAHLSLLTCNSNVRCGFPTSGS
jgi:hypothetical protein